MKKLLIVASLLCALTINIAADDRLYFAFNVPVAVGNQLKEIQQLFVDSLKANSINFAQSQQDAQGKFAGVKQGHYILIPVKQLHITVQFMGNLTTDQIETLKKIVEELKTACSLDLGKAIKNGTIEWDSRNNYIRLKLQESLVPSELIELRKTIREKLKKDNIPYDTSTGPFHISLIQIDPSDKTSWDKIWPASSKIQEKLLPISNALIDTIVVKKSLGGHLYKDPITEKFICLEKPITITSDIAPLAIELNKLRIQLESLDKSSILQ